MAWDEAQKISGKDPDFHRRDLWEAIENGYYPEWELGLQIVPEEDEHKYPFDILDATKIIPEELVPVIKVGKMTLNRNPDNFFAETEQVAFHPGHLVPGIDFSNDPLLQGRLFSYTDTQLSRLGSPNFHEIPINRSISPVHNGQRDGHMRQTINKDQNRANYHPNSIGGGCPFQAKAAEGGFTSYPERIDAVKIRNRSESFQDHFSQATLFFNSQSEAEKQHIIDALTFELGKVERVYIRERVLGLLAQIDITLASQVADGLGLDVPTEPQKPMNHGIGADANPDEFEPVKTKSLIKKSEALSMQNTPKDSIKTRKIAFLVADGVDGDSVSEMKSTLINEGATVKLIAAKLGYVQTNNKESLSVNGSFLTEASVLYDAVFVPSGSDHLKNLIKKSDSIHFINEAYRHCKAIATGADGEEFLKYTYINTKENGLDSAETGVLIGANPDEFVQAIAQHRFWDREIMRKVPA